MQNSWGRAASWYIMNCSGDMSGRDLWLGSYKTIPHRQRYTLYQCRASCMLCSAWTATKGVLSFPDHFGEVLSLINLHDKSRQTWNWWKWLNRRIDLSWHVWMIYNVSLSRGKKLVKYTWVVRFWMKGKSYPRMKYRMWNVFGSSHHHAYITETNQTACAL